MVQTKKKRPVADKSLVRKLAVTERKLNRIKERKKLKADRRRIERERRGIARDTMNIAYDLQELLSRNGG